MTKAILIDPFTKSVTEVEHDGTPESVTRLLSGPDAVGNFFAVLQGDVEAKHIVGTSDVLLVDGHVLVRDGQLGFEFDLRTIDENGDYNTGAGWGGRALVVSSHRTLDTEQTVESISQHASFDNPAVHNPFGFDLRVIPVSNLAHTEPVPSDQWSGWEEVKDTAIGRAVTTALCNREALAEGILSAAANLLVIGKPELFFDSLAAVSGVRAGANVEDLFKHAGIAAAISAYALRELTEDDISNALAETRAKHVEGLKRAA